MVRRMPDILVESLAIYAFSSITLIINMIAFRSIVSWLIYFRQRDFQLTLAGFIIGFIPVIINLVIGDTI